MYRTTHRHVGGCVNIRNRFEEKVLELVKLVFHICWNIFWGCFEGMWKEESLAEKATTWWWNW